MPRHANAAGTNGGADEKQDGISSLYYNAALILGALGCGRQNCPCVASVRKGTGLTHCPAHDDRTPSLDVTEKNGKTLVKCHADCDQNTVIEALRERDLWASTSTPRHGRRQSATGREVRHELRDDEGELVAVHVRRVDGNGKKTAGPWWELPDGTKNLNGRRVETLPLFGVEHLHDLPDGADVVLVEGETASDALHALGIASVATVCGASVTPLDDVLQPLVRLMPILWRDHDDPGEKHMMKIAPRLHELGTTPMTMNWPGARDAGDDAADFVARGGTAEDVRALVAEAEAWETPAEEDGAVLLNDLVAFIRRYVVLSDAQVEVVALWTMHTHAVDAADATPYLSIASAEKRSGKTRLLEVLEPIVANDWFTGHVTAAVLVRKIDRDRPTLLLDESDAALKGDKDYAEALRGILNNGHRRGAVVSLCVKAGGDFDLRDFSVFCPKAIAGIGRLPDTITDRSITVQLRRRAPGEIVERFRHGHVIELARPLRQRLETWATANIDTLRDARPNLPDELDDRAQDGWEPLLSIADAAGGGWPHRARRAAVALSTGDGREDDSFGVQLLRDIRTIFEAQAVDRLATADICTYLIGIDESPWGDLRGKTIDGRRLARFLRPYGIKPRTVRIEATTAKGYHREDFMDAFARYLPLPSGSVTSVTKPDSDSSDVTHVTDVTANTGHVCEHRPAGQADDLWARGDSTWGQDPRACPCCAGPVKGELLEPGGDDERCPTCRYGQTAPEQGDHLLRHALDLGLELAEAGA